MKTSLPTVAKLHWSNQLSDLTSVFCMSSLHVIEFDTDDDAIERLYKRYRELAVRSMRNANGSTVAWNTLVLRFAENEFVIARGDGCNDCEILAPTRERGDEILRELRKTLGKTQPKEMPGFSMLRNEGGDIYCEREENLPDASSDEFLQLCYGDDILTWIDTFQQTTAKRTGGFTLLDGPPGTGKTSLVTQMIQRLSKTHVFYVLPVTQASAFAAADFIPFWQRENTRRAGLTKVVVLEDADQLLQKRTDDSGTILPAMLNVADGLAGRMMRLHVICSVNCPMDHLDPAILRPGRLLNHRRFDRLPSDAARRVARHLNSDWQPESAEETYSLVQVLNPPVIRPTPTKRVLGFAA